MIEGYVSDDRVPYISVNLGNSEHLAVVDSGFNGDLDLPITLQASLSTRPTGEITSTLAGGISIRQELFQLELLFDGEVETVYVTFSKADELLLGTRLLRHHRLEIDFPRRALRLERSA